MYNSWKSWLCSMAVLAAAPLAGATPLINQEANVHAVNMANFSQRDLAQSFQQSAPTIAGAGIFLVPDMGRTDTVTISLWNNLPNAAGTMLAQASVAGTAGQWADVFWSPVAIAANTTYYLVFGGNNTLAIAGDTNNGYGLGQVYANTGYQSFANFDYAFRTFAAPVPEPTTVYLLLAGLSVLLLARRQHAGKSLRVKAASQPA